MGLDFFKEGNELNHISKEKLIQDIENYYHKNKEITNDMDNKEKDYLVSINNNLDNFLTKELNFISTVEKNDKTYSFIKNKEEYKIEVNDYFLTINKPNKITTYAYTIAYKDDSWEFGNLNIDGFVGTGYNYNKYNHNSYQNIDLNLCMNICENTKNIYANNKIIYDKINKLPLNEIFLFKIKESSASISRHDKDVKKYNNLIDFIKEIL